MNETPSKTEKIIHEDYPFNPLHETTDVLDVWSSKKNEVCKEVVDKWHMLFPNLNDDSGSSNEINDTVESSGLAMRLVTHVDMELGKVTHHDEEAEEDDEKQLADHITEHSVPLQVAPAAEEPDEAADTGISQCLCKILQNY
jgi:hypothetical protein